ncbi:STAS domain-containing protein [Cellulomonas sp. Marseille-Q8402]
MADDSGTTPHPAALAGRVWVDDADPALLHLAGEIDQPVVRQARDSITDDGLDRVDVVEMSGVTFVDSSLISLLANMTLRRPGDAEPLTLRHVPELAHFVLDLSGLTSVVKVVG